MKRKKKEEMSESPRTQNHRVTQRLYFAEFLKSVGVHKPQIVDTRAAFDHLLISRTGLTLEEVLTWRGAWPLRAEPSLVHPAGTFDIYVAHTEPPGPPPTLRAHIEALVALAVLVGASFALFNFAQSVR